MSLFLQFDKTMRLAQAFPRDVDYGVLDPREVFKIDGEGAAAEVRPEILKDIWPDVFHQLVGHAVLERGRTRDQIRVDAASVIQKRLNVVAVRNMEAEVWSLVKAREVVGRAAGSFWAYAGGNSDLPIEEKRGLERRLEELRDELDLWRSGENQARLSDVLRDFAGKLVPI